MSASIQSATDQPLLAPGELFEFLRLIWAVDHALQRASKRMATTLGVTGPQRLVIRMIGRFPGITAGQLARLFHVHPGTLTPMLKRLERDGLVQRRADPRDARRSLLGLTATGRQLHGATAGTIEDLIRAALASVSSVEVKGARAVLESIVRTLEDNSIKGTTQRRRHR